MSIYDDYSQNNEIDCKTKYEINDEEIEYCKSILETSRMYGMKDAIVDYIVKNRNNAHGLVDIIMKNDLEDTEQLKNNCSLFLFLITKNYLKSEVFKKDLKEARELKKEIFIILLEELDFENNLFHAFEIFDCTNWLDQNYRNFENITEKKFFTKEAVYTDEIFQKNCFLSYSINQEPTIKNIISKFPEFNQFKKHQRMFNRSTEIQISDVIVFFLTYDYRESELFKNDLEMAKHFKKLTLFVLIDMSKNIEDILNDFKFIIINLPIDSDINNEALNRFKIFFYRSFGLDRIVLDKNDDYFINLRLKLIKELDSFDSFDFEGGLQFISDNEIIMRYKKYLKVINWNNAYKVIGEIKINSDNNYEFTYQYIKHLDKIFVIERDNCSLYDKHGILSKKINFVILSHA